MSCHRNIGLSVHIYSNIDFDRFSNINCTVVIEVRLISQKYFTHLVNSLQDAVWNCTLLSCHREGYFKALVHMSWLEEKALLQAYMVGPTSHLHWLQRRASGSKLCSTFPNTSTSPPFLESDLCNLSNQRSRCWRYTWGLGKTLGTWITGAGPCWMTNHLQPYWNL